MARPKGSGTHPTRTALLSATARAARDHWLRYRVAPELSDVARAIGYRPRGLESAFRRADPPISWAAIKADSARFGSGGFWRDAA